MFDDKKFIGKTIQSLRKTANIKQSELAEKIGISEKHLSKIETGKNLPSLNNFLKMAQILKFSLNDFGIKEENIDDKYKEFLLKLIYSASDKEKRAYCEILKTQNNIIKMYNNG